MQNFSKTLHSEWLKIDANLHFWNVVVDALCSFCETADFMKKAQMGKASGLVLGFPNFNPNVKISY